jgi:3-hydroxyisobutyrate dehydrogenase-like beta-hydroxyacid dehydrogenase
MKRVGFIGLGNMGASMAKNLIKSTTLKKESVMVFDLNKDMMRKFTLPANPALLLSTVAQHCCSAPIAQHCCSPPIAQHFCSAPVA